jgi:outer membrane protein OmpA-like peptidoglycan-associated protein
VDPHADNIALSKARSDAILALLKNRGGITETAMQSVPMGDAEPPFPNTTAELRKKNRTVVLKLVPAPSG